MTSTRLYLAELEELLATADPAVRAELLDGIREELDGLEPAAAAERMRTLGDPAHIAAEALADSVPAPAAGVTASARRHDPAWYSVVTVLLLAIGGWIIPVLGGVAGLVMLWMSATWRARDKVIGTLAALSSPAIMLLGVVPWTTEATIVVSGGPGEVNPLVPDAAANPPGGLILLIALALLWLGGHIWLLVAADRARRL